MIFFCRFPIAVGKSLSGPHGTTKSPPAWRVCNPCAQDLKTRFAALLARDKNYPSSPRITAAMPSRHSGRPWFNVIPIVCVEVQVSQDPLDIPHILAVPLPIYCSLLSSIHNNTDKVDTPAEYTMAFGKQVPDSCFCSTC